MTIGPSKSISSVLPHLTIYSTTRSFTEARSRNNRPTAAVGGLAGGAGQSTKK
jgi:hypothetical protein